MAIPTNTFLTFSQIGAREDLRDVIYNISPTETPFLSMAKAETANAVLHEWQTDTLAAAAANAHVEGGEFAGLSLSPTTRVNNRTQISRKDVVVSNTTNAVNLAGRTKEMVYQMAKVNKELRRDMEFILLSNQAPVTGNSTTARQLRPLLSWYSTTVNGGVGAGNGSATTARTDGTQRAFTEAFLKDVKQRNWAVGGEADYLLVGPFNKTVVSGFTGGATKFDHTDDKKVYATVDVYVSDFGEIKIVADRFQRERDAHLIDFDYVCTAYLRPVQTIDVGVTGDNIKGILITEYTLVNKNESAHALIADLTTS